MKKYVRFPIRFLSVVLSIVLCFGALPFVSAEGESTGLFFEGESFADSVSVSGGSAAYNDLAWLSQTTWSNNAMLTWSDAAEGNTLTLEVDIPTAGTYDLEVVLGASHDYGMVDVSMDGTVLWNDADTYNTGWGTPLRLIKEAVSVEAGKHTFVFTHAGKNAASAGAVISIDYINFAKIESKLFYEGEEFDGRAVVSGGSVAAQDLSGLSTVIWSNNAMLTWSNPAAGNTLTLAVNIPEDGTYDLEMVFGASWDYGMVDVSLDGTEVFADVDAYKTAWDSPVKVTAEDMTLTAGKHTFVLTHDGQNAESTGATISLDYIKFIASDVEVEIESKLFYEGEEFGGFAVVTGGSAAPQDLSGLSTTTWSNNAMLTWSNPTVGDTMTFDVNIPAEGTYDLEMMFGASWDYGMVDVSLDGTEVFADVDTYKTAWDSPVKVTTKAVSLTAGKHTFVLTHAGQNTESTGATISLDYIEFIVPVSVPTDLFIEGESLVPTVTAGNAFAFDLAFVSTTLWSDNTILFWRDDEEKGTPGVDDTLTVEVDIPVAGTYYPSFNLVTASDYGIVDVAIDGTVVITDADCYGAMGTKRFDVSAIELSAGKHTIVFTVKGQNDRATNCFFGVDYIEFLTKSREETIVPQEPSLFYEGEDLVDMMSATGGIVSYNDLAWLSTSTWSNNAMATWAETEIFDELTFPVNLPQTGVYDVEIMFGVSWDYGMVDVYLDDTYIGTQDCYAAGWAAPISLAYDALQLTKGTHTFTLVQSGQNDSSEGVFISVDYIQFTQNAQEITANASLYYEGGELEATVTGGEAKNEEDLLLWTGSAAEDTLTFDIYLPEANIYTVDALFATGADHGKVALAIDDQVIIDETDCYNGSDSTVKSTASEVYLTGGAHTVTLKLLSQNDASTGTSIGLDYLEFIPSEDFLSYPDIVRKLYDMEQIALLDSEENSDEFSSYDRSARYDEGTDTYINWSANVDGTGYLYETEDGAHVIAEMEGPGYISHIMIGTELTGDLVIYIDGEEAIRTPFIDLISGKIMKYTSLTYKREDRSCNLYIPISYNESCKIVMYPSFEGAWNENLLNYYQIQYTTLPDSYTVENFTYPLNEVNAAALGNADSIWAGKESVLSEGTDITKDISVSAGQTVDIHTAEGQNAISRLAFELKSENVDLSKLVMRMYWDGSSTAAAVVTLADYFAECYKTVEYTSYVTGYDGDTLWNNWFMPYADGCRITLENRSDTDVALGLTVRISALSYDIEKYGRFCVNWKQLADGELSSDRGVDSNFLTLTGSGRFVGSVLHVFQNIQGIWWGEGDVKIFIDGEKFPSWHGTGSEDYFGYAWSTQYIFNKALHGQPQCEGGMFTTQGQEGMSGNTVNYRWHMSDTIPFHTSFDGNIEKYFEDPTVLEAYTSFYYLNAEDVAKNPANEFTEEDREFNTGLLDEPKTLFDNTEIVVGSKVSGGTMGMDTGLLTSLQYPSSDGSQATWKGADVGDTLTLTVNLPTSAIYDVEMLFTKAADYGKIKVSLDGQVLLPEMDGYSSGAYLWQELSEGIPLLAGEHTITIEIIGKNSATNSCFVGVDYIQFIPTQEFSGNYGDINQDGKIDAADALLALQHSVQLITLEGERAAFADVNLDGKIDAADALCILQYSVDLIQKLPVS